jgi:hypothetical protein
MGQPARKYFIEGIIFHSIGVQLSKVLKDPLESSIKILIFRMRKGVFLWERQ